jgi:hypothetical protein
MMRRLFPLALLLLLPACSYVGNPFAGIGSFFGDTVSYNTKPNSPRDVAPNMQRVRGEDVTTEPLLTEEGNVWPGPLPPAKTLSDLEHEANGTTEPEPTMRPRGSSTPPQGVPAAPPGVVSPTPRNQPVGNPSAQNRTYQTPTGPAIGNRGPNGVETVTTPNGSSGIVQRNANGSSTITNGDGSTVSVPPSR